MPAYEAMAAGGSLGERVLEILMHNVSTRSYGKVITEMADSVGVSRSSVSCSFVESSARELQSLAERSFGGVELLIIYIDDLVFGEHHLIAAVGVDAEGR